MIEEKEFDVVLTVRLHTRVYFAPIERDSVITAEDAADNAMGMLQDSTWDDIYDEFLVEIDYDAEDVTVSGNV